MSKSLNLDEPEDFERLITALRKVGLEAYAWESGGGIRFVCVDVPTADGSWMAAAAGSNGAPCEIGILTEDPDKMPPGTWSSATSIPQAVALVGEAARRYNG